MQSILSDRQILSVSQLNRNVRHLIETQLPLLWVEGEISNFARPASGHWYLTLKDDQAQVRCAMFRNANQRVAFQPANVGKSTLVNRLLGEDRVVVYDEAGTTRDSVYIDYERHGQEYTLIDTAGIRKRKNIKLAVEKFSIVKTLQAIDDANVVILLVDAQEGLVEQDLHLMGSVIDAGRGLVVGINKWDGLDPEKREKIKADIKRRLRFAEFADVHFISALHGTGVGNLYDSIGAAYSAATDTLSASRLTKVLEGAVEEHQPPMVHGRRIKLRFAHAGGRNPPVIIIHGNQTDSVPAQYTRYLEKIFRRELGLHGTPVRVEYRTGDNPYKTKAITAKAKPAAKRAKVVKYSKRNDPGNKKR
ncbi:ribosome biogenesis GTPase Der [Porticoccaceae bacterium]|nr:ribosome biogenesis GTPase Der [Porticoccaceae bacterium]